MKKAVIILCTLLILAMTGCSNNQPVTTSAAAADMPLASSESVNPNSASENQSSEASQKNNNEIPAINGIISDYNVVRTGFDKNSNDIKIFFPQINGISDKEKQAKINDLIRKTALLDTQNNINLYEADLNLYSAFDMDYTIMWTSNNLLSVLFYGYYDEKQAPHPNRVCNTVNIDMKTGDIIRLPDIISTNSDFVQLFINKSQFVDGGGTLDFAAIKNDYFDADNLKYDFDEDAAFYFTSTGIVFTVSTAHVIGDYALFSLNFSDFSKYIKEKSQWEDIKSDLPATNFQIIRDQCFKTALTGFEGTWFVSGFDRSSNGIIESLKFYLLDEVGNVKYTFPDFDCNSLGYYGIRAVAFSDVNRDGEKDVIIIAALNQNGGTEYDEAKVYLSNKNGFVMDKELNSYISKNLEGTKTVGDVLDAGKGYFK